MLIPAHCVMKYDILTLLPCVQGRKMTLCCLCLMARLFDQAMLAHVNTTLYAKAVVASMCAYLQYVHWMHVRAFSVV